jgi:hypothetical protein
MVDELTHLVLPSNLWEWPKLFSEAQLDCVLDPMVARAAELFIGGRDYCRQMTQREDDEFWPTIENNMDGILTFFHILMTRERIPLIDYGETFITRIREWIDPSILLWTSAGSVYNDIKQKALTRLEGAAANLPHSDSLERDRELLSFGYFWQPSLEGLSIMPERTAAAQFVLGGLIFGEYAQAGGADHVLQSKRLHMMSTLDVETQPIADDWRMQEQALFAELAKLMNQDKALRTKNERALPNVLLHLLARGAKSPRALLDDALELRASPAGKSYRTFHKRIRDGWRSGRRDTDAEQQIKAVADEFKKRISGKPTVITHLIIDANFKAGVRARGDAGIAAAHFDANVTVTIPETRVEVTVPQGLRNWFVDNILLSRHQKLLLRMAQDQRSFDDVRRGLRAVWQAA